MQAIDSGFGVSYLAAVATGITRTLVFLPEGVEWSRSRIDLPQLDYQLNARNVTHPTEAISIAYSEFSRGGSFNSSKELPDGYVRDDPKATSAILVHAAAGPGLASDVEISLQIVTLSAADALAMERQQDGRWTSRFVSAG